MPASRAEAAASWPSACVSVYETIERPLVPILRKMEATRHRRGSRRAAPPLQRFCAADGRARKKIHKLGRARIQYRLARRSSARSCSMRWGAQAAQWRGAEEDQDRRLRDGRRTCWTIWPPRATSCRKLVLDWRELAKLKIDLHRCADRADQPGDGPRAHLLFDGGGVDGAAVVERSQSAEHPGAHRGRAARSGAPSWRPRATS